MWADALWVGTREMREEGEELVELPTFTHVDKEIVYPATSRPLPARIINAPHATAFFDGGAAK